MFFFNNNQKFRFSRLSLAMGLVLTAQQTLANEQTTELETLKIIATAQEELKQAPGVSLLTADDIRKTPPANDISELLRKQPGVNLTGNSGSGARGNNRQIDIRGMGPENTLILIDGKPVASKNAVRYGWRGERDTRGDTNWVPADQIERIEILRGPAAARYGNGAAGGVINIITKGASTEHHGDVTIYMNKPQHSEEGDSKRINFNLSGPIASNFSYRLYGNLNKTDMDDPGINKDKVANPAGKITSGREGVRNKDINGLLSWYLTDEQTLELDTGFSRQGNIYGGDSMNNNAGALEGIREPWLGRETNITYRQNYAFTHRGDWGFGETVNFVQYEKTKNSRLEEGLAGGPEGNFVKNPSFGSVELDTLIAHSEVSVPLNGLVNQVVTLGAEWVDQRMEDPFSNTQATNEGGVVPGIQAKDRDTKSSAHIFSVFVDSNIELAPGTLLTPGLRFDQHSEAGSNWSPALNLSQALGDSFTLKAGIAQAYKAPNLYQNNSNYLLYSRGNGCWGGGGACYLQGNEELKAETSINKEIGLEFRQNELVVGATWFRNDYKNKVESGKTKIGNASGGTGTFANADVFEWENVPKAIVEGFEGTLSFPLAANLNWSTNFTYMERSENRTTGEPLSIIPKYTVNSMLDWQVLDPLAVQVTATWYGKQTPGKLGYKGEELSGDSIREISSYAVVGLSSQYVFNKHLRATLGVSNLFDERLYREGNTVDAGAYTYNEPGRTFYTSITSSF